MDLKILKDLAMQEPEVRGQWKISPSKKIGMWTKLFQIQKDRTNHFHFRALSFGGNINKTFCEYI